MISFPQPDVENFFQTFGIQSFTIAPDESQLVFSTNLNGKYNLWAMDLPDTFPYPLSFYNQSCSELVYDKNGQYILAVIDNDGDENGQVYALPPFGGDLKRIRYQNDARHMMLRLSEDGKRLYYTSNKENKTYLKSYCYELNTEKENVIIHGEDTATYLYAKSQKEETFIYIKMFGNTYSLAYAKYGGKELLLTPETSRQHTVLSPVFITETLIYFITNFDSDFSYLAQFDLEKNEFTKVAEVEDEDFMELYYNESANALYVSSEKGVIDHLYRVGLEDHSIETIDLPASVIDGVHLADSGTLYINAKSATRPSNIYQLKSGVWTSLTNYGVPGLIQEELCEPEIHTYSSFDGLKIEAQLFKAKKSVSNGHVILWPHGGPQAAERATFRSLFQFLVHRGYSIFAPNFRGSTGYGLAFSKMVEGDWGHGPRLDNIQGLEYLIEQGFAERNKILLMGGSYGGYMALLLHGRHPQYFKAVVDIFGPSNLFSFIESVPEHWKPLMKQWVGDAVENKEKLTEDSPIQYLDTMTKPMLVIQGAKDPRVVKAESDQIVQALKEKGREVDYLVLEDEGHGFSKKENEIKVYRKVLAFFDQHIESSS